MDCFLAGIGMTLLVGFLLAVGILALLTTPPNEQHIDRANTDQGFSIEGDFVMNSNGHQNGRNSVEQGLESKSTETHIRELKTAEQILALLPAAQRAQLQTPLIAPLVDLVRESAFIDTDAAIRMRETERGREIERFEHALAVQMVIQKYDHLVAAIVQIQQISARARQQGIPPKFVDALEKTKLRKLFADTFAAQDLPSDWSPETFVDLAALNPPEDEPETVQGIVVEEG